MTTYLIPLLIKYRFPGSYTVMKQEEENEEEGEEPREKREGLGEGRGLQRTGRDLEGERRLQRSRRDLVEGQNLWRRGKDLDEGVDLEKWDHPKCTRNELLSGVSSVGVGHIHRRIYITSTSKWVWTCPIH